MAAKIDTYEAFRRALVRRAASVKKLHANRKHTAKPDGIPKKDAEKHHAFIDMSPEGDFAITQLLKGRIAELKAKLQEERDAAASARKRQRTG